MATTTNSAFWMEDIVRISDPMRIGKHEWRLVLYRATSTRYELDPEQGRRVRTERLRRFVDYEWRRCERDPEHWRRARDWPRYDFNDGQYSGLPRTLRKLWESCPWAQDPGDDDTTAD